MKVININPTNSYSCQICGCSFISKEELDIFPGHYPICSSKCVFMLYYKTLKVYDKKDLVLVANSLNIINPNKLSDNSLLFEVTKKYPKPILSSINIKGQKDKDKIKGTTDCPKGQKDNKTPSIYLEGLSLCLSLTSKEQEKEIVPNSKGGLLEWF